MTRFAAALAFYTVFSLAPMLVTAIAVASIVFGEQAARGEIVSRFHSLVGPDVAELIQTILVRAGDKSSVATAIGLGTFLFGATIVFAELQEAFNAIWGIAAKPGKLVQSYFKQRLVAFAIVLGVGLLLLLLLFASAIISAAAEYLPPWVQVPAWLIRTANHAVFVTVITLLFAVAFKVLPDVKVPWKDVFVGAAVTSLLFLFGKALIEVYLQASTLRSVYGAAGSLVVVLIWVYYSSQVLLLGAEFTSVYARNRGASVELYENAIWLNKLHVEDIG